MSDPLPLPVDTGVLITLAAAMGNWDFFAVLDRPIIVTPAVLDELRRGPAGRPGVETPLSACMSVWQDDVAAPVWMQSVLEEGEASVIALALERGWPEVAIDEKTGRSMAKACRLRLTGSLGLLIRAKRRGFPLSLAASLPRIRAAGVRLGPDLEHTALRLAGEA